MGDDHDNEALFERLYRYYPGVVAFLKRFPEFSHEEVRELAQDVFARVYEYMDTYRGESDWGYVQSVARTVAFNARRAILTEKRRGKAVALEELSDMPARGTDSPARRLRSKEVSQRIHDAMSQLPATYRTILMVYLSDASYKEIAARLNISVATVKSRLRDAREKLRPLLGEPDGLGVIDDQ